MFFPKVPQKGEAVRIILAVKTLMLLGLVCCTIVILTFRPDKRDRQILVVGQIVFAVLYYSIKFGFKDLR